MPKPALALAPNCTQGPPAHPREVSVADFDKSKIKGKPLRQPREDIRKKLENGAVKEVMPKHDDEEIRKALGF